MTVIAYDGKVLAADKRMTGGTQAITVTKIRRLPRGRMAGMAGDVMDGRALLDWLEKGGRLSVDPENNDCNSEVMVIDKGQILLYGAGIGLKPVPLDTPFHAIGSGAPYALAAMACGKSAIEAIEIACKFDVACGNGIDVLEPEVPRAVKKRARR